MFMLPAIKMVRVLPKDHNNKLPTETAQLKSLAVFNSKLLT